MDLGRAVRSALEDGSVRPHTKVLLEARLELGLSQEQPAPAVVVVDAACFTPRWIMQ